MKQTLSAKNKAFWAKSKPDQRIAVAKDVIASLKTEFYLPIMGSYFMIKGIHNEIKDAPEKLDGVLSILKKEKAYCQVCGIGACFTSLVNLGNNAVTNNCLAFGIKNGEGINDSDMRPLLRKVFTPSQLSMIECAFEVDSIFNDKKDHTNDENREKAESFGGKFDNNTERLVAIMKNIIKNKGTFKP